MCVHCVSVCVCVHATVQVYVTIWMQESLQQKSISESPCESESHMVMSYCSSSQCLSPSSTPHSSQEVSSFFLFHIPCHAA